MKINPIHLLIAITAITVTSCSKTATNGPSDDPTRKSKPDFGPLAEQDFEKEYHANGAAFDQKYKGKTVCIEGQIKLINPGKVFLFTLSYSPTDVVFEFDPQEAPQLQNLQLNTDRRIMGVYEGDTDVRLNFKHCILTN